MGDLGALSRAIGAAERLTVVLDPDLVAAYPPSEAMALVAALAPAAVIELGAPADPGSVLLDPDGLAVAVAADSQGAAVPAMALQAAWDAEASRSLGASHVVWLADPGPEPPTPTGASVGSCAPAIAALASGQEQSLVVLEAFLDDADALLGQLYRAELTQAIPALEHELAAYASSKTREQLGENRSWETYQCGRAAWAYVQELARCRSEDEDACPSSPRMFLAGGARIGAAEPTVLSDGQCRERLGRGLIARLRRPAEAAATAAVDQLDHGSVVLADRLGALTEVAAVMEDICMPRRWRFAESDVEDARARLEQIGQDLASHDRQGGAWRVEADEFHVAGIGAVHQLTRFASRPGGPTASAIAGARGLRQFVLNRARCHTRDGDRPPLAVVVIDAKQAQANFVGVIHADQLVCAQLVARELTGAPAAGAPRPR